MPDYDWVEKVDALTFLAIFDVLLDIEQDLNIAAEEVSIPLLPSVVRFAQLIPVDSIVTRDRYCELRWEATGFLKKQGVIRNYEFVKEFHRWQGRLAIEADEAVIRQTLAVVRKAYKGRTADNGQMKVADEQVALERVRQLLSRFHEVVVQLRQRHDGRSTLDISDEHDVQDLLRVLLCLFFDDIRREEWTPSYLGKSSRVDIFLKPEGLVVEAKKTGPSLGEKQIGDQLIVDAERYRQMPSCKRLICFVYDPEERISNPGGFQADMFREDKEFAVEVLVVPKRY